MADDTGDANTDLVPAESFAIVGSDTDQLTAVMEQNIGGQLSEFDLDRIGIPPGGGTSWTIPTLAGEEEVKELEGIIVHWKSPRAYWDTPFEESGGGPPDCSSPDSIHGFGMFGGGSEVNPSGLCGDCPMSDWGSAEGESQGQACKQMRVMFLVRPGDMLPIAVVAPPTSITNIRKYFLRLASRSIPYYGVVTKLSLRRVENANGLPYSQMEPTLAGQLDPKAADEVKAYGDAIRESLNSTVDVITQSSADHLADEPSDSS